MIKKVILLVLIFVVFFGFSACKKDDIVEPSDSGTVSDVKATPSAVKTSPKEVAAPDTVGAALPLISGDSTKSQKTIETYVKDLIREGFDKVSVDTLTIMDNYATPEGGDYTVYAMLSFEEELGAAESRTTLEGYAATMASMINANCGNVSELSIVWFVPSLNGRGNIKYINADGMLSLSDLSFDSTFGSSYTTTDGAVTNESGTTSTAVTSTP